MIRFIYTLTKKDDGWHYYSVTTPKGELLGKFAKNVNYPDTAWRFSSIHGEYEYTKNWKIVSAKSPSKFDMILNRHYKTELGHFA